MTFILDTAYKIHDLTYTLHGEAVHRIGPVIKQAPEDIGIRLSAIEVLLRAGLWWDADYCARQLLAQQPEDIQVQKIVGRVLASHPHPMPKRYSRR